MEKKSEVKKLLEDLATLIKKTDRVINKEFKPIAPKFNAWKVAIPIILKSNTPETKGLPLLRDVWKTLPQAYAYFTTTRSRAPKAIFLKYHKTIIAKKSLIFWNYTPYKAVKLSPAEITAMKLKVSELSKQLKAKTDLYASLKSTIEALQKKMIQERKVMASSSDAALVAKLKEAATKRKAEIGRTQALLLKAQKTVETLQSLIDRHTRDLDAQKNVKTPQDVTAKQPPTIKAP